MADIADVRDALVDLINQQFYPDNRTVPERPVKVYAGWPDPETLNNDLTKDPAFPITHISVWPLPMERNTTRYPDEIEETGRDARTYDAAVIGQSVTFTGAPPEPYRAQNAAIVIDGRGFVLRITAGQTPAQLAAAFLAEISPVWPSAFVIANTITIPNPARITAARVGVFGGTRREVARQEKGFQVTIWAATDDIRVWAGRIITPAIAASVHLPLGDGTMAYLQCRSNVDSDKSQLQSAYRRDLVYTIEYATTEDRRAPEMIVARTDVVDPAHGGLTTVDE